MKENVRQYYIKSEHFTRYLMSDKRRVKNIKDIYKTNKRYFGKNVLDICCGGGILGFIIEPNGHKYLGIDINPDMINNAKKYAKTVKSKARFVLADVSKNQIKGKFNTITLIGNALIHFNTYEFLNIMKNLKKNYKKGTYFIIDYRDVVELLFKKQWKDKMIEKNKGKTVISLTTGCDTNKGEIYKSASERSGKNRIIFKHTIWSPFIIEPLMKTLGWKLVKRKRIERWQGWIDVYKKV